MGIAMNNQIHFRMLFSTLCGIFLEYFDFTLYGFSAPIIANLFFPEKNLLAATLFTWGVFALGFLVRPLGAIIIGHFSDRFGRKQVLLYTILGMSFSTCAIGFLPTYSDLGIIAPLLLMTCRIIQGLAVCTEYTGCSTYLFEFKNSRKGLLSGIITSSSGLGIFAASLLVLLFHNISWRYPFIISGALIGLLGLYLRLGLNETPEYLAAKNQNTLEQFPLLSLLRKTPALLIKMIIISAFAGVLIIVIEIYLPNYLQSHYFISRQLALSISTYLALTEAVFAIICGWISDYIGQKKMMTISAILTIFLIFPLMHLFSSGNNIIYFLAAGLLAVIVAAIDGPIGVFLINQFPTSVRYSGVSLSYNLGAALFGGLSPSILIALQNQAHISFIFEWYLIIAGLIALSTLHFSLNKSKTS